MADSEREQPKPVSARARDLKRQPWYPPDYELADATALQALSRGEASPDQQKRALRWIIQNAAATYDMTFHPGADEGRRNTDFAEGRRFVGNQCVKLLNLVVSKMPHAKHADEPEPRD